MSGGNCYPKKDTLSQHYCNSNNNDVSCGYVFKTAKISPNAKIQIPLRILMTRLKRVMLMWLVDMVLNRHTPSQYEDSSRFKNIDGDVYKGDVSSGYDSMTIHTDLEQNYLE